MDFEDQLPGEDKVFEKINKSLNRSPVSSMRDQNKRRAEDHHMAYVMSCNQNVLGNLNSSRPKAENDWSNRKVDQDFLNHLISLDRESILSQRKEEPRIQERSSKRKSQFLQAQNSRYTGQGERDKDADSFLIITEENFKKAVVDSAGSLGSNNEPLMFEMEEGLYINEESLINEKELLSKKKTPKLQNHLDPKQKDSNRYRALKRINSVSVCSKKKERDSQSQHSFLSECGQNGESPSVEEHEVPCLLLKPKRDCDRVFIYLHGNAEDIFQTAEMAKGIRDELDVNFLLAIIISR
jgi:hypothetical protein